jgi:hypothetical protein
MPIKPLLTHLVSSSTAADQMSANLKKKLSSSSDDSLASLVSKLNTEIQTQRQLIKLLQQELLEDTEADVDMSDEEEQAFLITMEAIFQKMTFAELEFGYSDSNLKGYTKHVRYLLALALVNYCAKNGFTPHLFWQQLVSNNGVI